MAPASRTTATTAGPAPAPRLPPRRAEETLAEREERWLAEAALPVGQPAGPPQAAPNQPGPPAQEPVPAGEAAPAA